MKTRTYISTDWIEVYDHDSTYMARVFLTDNDEAYMVVKTENKTRFFKVKSELLRSGELGFFEKVMERSIELPIKQIGDIRLANNECPS
jgi:hypothetical protein